MNDNISLSTLFEERDEQFAEITAEIFDRIPNVLEGVYTFLVQANEGYENGTVSWEDVFLLDNVLTLIGIVSYKPGTEFVLEGKPVEVTEANSAYFQRIIRMGIPLNVAEEGTVEDILEFFSNIKVNFELTVNEDGVQEEDLIATVKEPEFDMSELTDEQRDALFMYYRGKMN